MTRPTEDPSADVLSDPRLGRVVAAFQDELDAGREPDRAEYVRRYPDLAPGLDGCLRAIEFVRAAMTPPPTEGGPRLPEAVAPGATLGDFRVLRELGRGGMGVVFEAEQVSLGRRVALKILPALAALDERARQRFRHEAQAAAALRHPHIVPVHGVGQTGDVHYFWMPLVRGRSLAAIIRDATGPVPAAPGDTLADPATSRSPEAYRRVAAQMRDAADALDHAHQCGVIHRDVKPANFLLDEAGHLWLLDFGLARLPGSDLTGTADVMGTLRYMSPEQASGRAVASDGQSDVYSLGATFYESLTFRAAFPATDRETLLRQILSAEPVAPRTLAPGLPVDLETILLKAMAKDPADRYRSAADLRDDLDRFLADRPILATPPTAFHRAGKWVRRNRVLVGLAAAAAVVTLAAVTAVLAVSRRELAAKQAATQKALDGESNARNDLDRALAGEKAARAAEQRTNYAHTLAYAWHEFAAGNAERANELLLRTPAGPRGWEYDFLRRGLDARLATLDLGFAPPVTVRVAVAPDRAAFAAYDALRGAVRVIDARTFGVRATIAAGRDVTCAVGPGGAYVAVVSHPHVPFFRPDTSDRPATVTIFDARDRPGHVLARVTVPSDVTGLAAHPAGRRVAYGTFSGTVAVWDWGADDRGPPLAASEKPVTHLAYDPAGQRLAFAHGDLVSVYDVGTTRSLTRLESSALRPTSLAWHPSGLALGVGGAAGGFALYRAPFGKPAYAAAPATTPVRTVTFSPDGQAVAVAAERTRAVALLGTKDGAALRTIDGHDAGQMSVAFVGGGRVLVSAGTDGRLGVWDSSGLAGGLVPVSVTEAPSVAAPYVVRFHAPFGPEGETSVELCDPASDTFARTLTVPAVPLPDHHYRFRTVAVSADGRVATVANVDGRRYRFDLATGQRTGQTDATAEGTWERVTKSGDLADYSRRGQPRAALSPDGSVFASARRGEVLLRDALTDRVLASDPGGPARSGLRFSPDGKRLFVHAPDGLDVWDVPSAAKVARLVAPLPLGVAAVADKGDGRHLALLGRDNVLYEVEWASGVARRLWDGSRAGATSLCYAPDGRSLLVGLSRSRNRQGGVLVYDLVAGDELLTLPSEFPVQGIAFDRTGRRLLLTHDTGGWAKCVDLDARPATAADGLADRLRQTESLWHELELKRGETANHYEPALWHVDRLLASRPGAAPLLARKAAIVRKSADVAAVTRDVVPFLIGSLGTTPNDILFWYRSAAVALEAGDAPAYRRVCDEVRTRLLARGDPFFQSCALRLMTFGPDALGDPQALLDLIPTVPGRNHAEATRAYIQGSALYRAGRYAEARPLLASARAMNEKNDFGRQCTVFLAMTDFRRGQVDSAKALLAEVDGWVREHLGPTPPQRPNPDRKVDVVLPVLRAEAAKMMGVE